MMPPDAPPEAQAEASSKDDQSSPAEDVVQASPQSTQPTIMKYLAGGFMKPEDTADAKPSDQAGGNDQDGDIEEEETKPTRVKIRRVDRIFNMKTRQWELVKTVKPKVQKKFRRDVILVARQMNPDGTFSGQYYVEIRSTYLKELLNKIFAEAGDVQINSPPGLRIRLLFHARVALNDELDALRKLTLPDPDEVFELEALVEFIQEHFASEMLAIAGFTPGHTDFQHAWTWFSPGTLLYSTGQLGEERISQLFGQPQETRKPGCGDCLDMTFKYVDFDGTNLRWRYHSGMIPKFAGTVPIASLPHSPLHLHPTCEEIRSNILQRSRDILRLHGRHIQEYEGHALQPGGDGKMVKFNSHGRIMIDPAMILKLQPGLDLVSTSGEVIKTEEESSDKDKVQDSDEMPQEKDLSEELRLLLCPLLYGFSLGDKIWGAFDVSLLRKVHWNESIIDNLILDEVYKEFIQTLVPKLDSVQSSSRSSFDDIVRDKGKGLIGLFVGPPGVGKTLTAEVISEVSRRPLYVIGSGELGDSPARVMSTLTEIMELAEEWNAVLLLDEADVFMTERDNVNLARNANTSVFLRLLEYFQGTMVLTTNRLKSFDPAFKSRIHFCIQFSELSEESRASLWQIFLDRVPDSMIKPEDRLTLEQVTKLASRQLNGRQIKNAMSVAQRYAQSKGKGLDFESIVRAIEFSQSGWGDFGDGWVF